MILIQEEDFSVDEICAAIKKPGMGAMVTFKGMVRGASRDGVEVKAVVWDVYKMMAYKIFEAIRNEAISDFRLIDAAIVHRMGRQEPSDNLVLIVAGSAHRKEAFEACEWMMNEIKKRVPLWKKEILANGEERWIEG